MRFWGPPISTHGSMSRSGGTCRVVVCIISTCQLNGIVFELDNVIPWCSIASYHTSFCKVGIGESSTEPFAQLPHCRHVLVFDETILRVLFAHVLHHCVICILAHLLKVLSRKLRFALVHKLRGHGLHVLIPVSSGISESLRLQGFYKPF